VDAGALVRVHRTDALRFMGTLAADAYDVAFADPPYDLGLAAQVAERWLEIPFAGLLGVEHRAFEPMPEGGERRQYGSTAVTLYRMS
jgi:16S rRNA (guanine966-N2)-methyltransferase